MTLQRIPKWREIPDLRSSYVGCGISECVGTVTSSKSLIPDGGSLKAFLVVSREQNVGSGGIEIGSEESYLCGVLLLRHVMRRHVGRSLENRTARSEAGMDQLSDLTLFPKNETKHSTAKSLFGLSTNDKGKVILNPPSCGGLLRVSQSPNLFALRFGSMQTIKPRAEGGTYSKFWAGVGELSTAAVVGPSR